MACTTHHICDCLQDKLTTLMIANEKREKDISDLQAKANYWEEEASRYANLLKEPLKKPDLAVMKFKNGSEVHFKGEATHADNF